VVVLVEAVAITPAAVHCKSLKNHWNRPIVLHYTDTAHCSH